MAEAADELKKLLGESGIALNSEIAKQLQTYLALLEKWNSRINLTSATEWNVVGPLFQEGIWASKMYPEDTCQSFGYWERRRISSHGDQDSPAQHSIGSG